MTSCGQISLLGRRVIRSGFAANPNQLLSSTSSRLLSRVCVFLDRLRDPQSVGFLSTYYSSFVWMCTIDLEYSQNFRMLRLVYGDAIKTLANHSLKIPHITCYATWHTYVTCHIFICIHILYNLHAHHNYPTISDHIISCGIFALYITNIIYHNIKIY